MYGDGGMEVWECGYECMVKVEWRYVSVGMSVWEWVNVIYMGLGGTGCRFERLDCVVYWV